jgi:hypothetical protein
MCYAFTLKAQNYYAFSKSVGTYTPLTGSTTLINGAWVDFGEAVKLPFPFKLYSTSFTDSFYINDYGTISLVNNYNEEIAFLGFDLNSRGSNLSEVSYKVEGTAPNRIFKLQFSNAGFYDNGPPFNDFFNIQAWLYETSNIIEFKYGASSVATATWGGSGPVAGLFNPVNPIPPTSFILLEGNPANPTVNTNDLQSSGALTLLPVSGTTYTFTPSQFPAGINNPVANINVVQNKISLPSNIVVKQIKIININGQVLQTAANAEDIDMSRLPHGLYVLSVETTDGVLYKKLLL